MNLPATSALSRVRDFLAKLCVGSLGFAMAFAATGMRWWAFSACVGCIICGVATLACAPKIEL